MMDEAPLPHDVWTPLYRSDVQTLLTERAYTALHLSILFWLIWLPLLSIEELFRLLSKATGGPISIQAELAEQLATMSKHGLIDAVLLREPAARKEQRYYVTDLGLYLYSTVARSFPPLSVARLARSYPVERDDLLSRLARPGLHLALSTLVTRLLAEGTLHGDQLVSYQQPWRHRTATGKTYTILSSDAALLIQQAHAATYAFQVYVETAQQASQFTQQWVRQLLEQRERLQLSRQRWPDLLILTLSDRLSNWPHLLLESHIAQATRSLSGGMTTLDAMAQGLYTPIWYDLATLKEVTDLRQASRLPFSQLLREPASTMLAEQVSQQRRFFAVLLKEAAASPRMGERLTRYVGDSLQDEATQLNQQPLARAFHARRKTRQSTEASGLLTLALSAQEKTLLTWNAQHPLLDLPTLQALLRTPTETPTMQDLEQMRIRLTHLGLLETRIWPAGSTPFEQQRSLLTPVGLKFLATRQGVPFSLYFLHPKYYKEGEDEQLQRQWGTRGLARQMAHTHGLYTFMRQLFAGTQERGEVLLRWNSAHASARSYRDPISGQTGHARPDAELLFALTPAAEPMNILLEYDRATTSEREYTRKFRAYLDYQQATGIALPLLLVVTPSQKAEEKMQLVLSALGGGLQMVIMQERDVLEKGLTLALPPLLERRKGEEKSK